jgi:hypothetical protein
MRELNLDFRRQDRKARRAGMLLLAAGLAGVVALGAQYRELADEVSAAEASLRPVARAAGKAKSAALAGGDVQKVSFEFKRAAEIVHQLTLPWGELFASAESAAMPDVALLSIESDTDKRRVKISGEAKNLEAVLQYLRFLAARPALADVYLQSHDLQKQDPQRPVRFVLSAEWRVRK